MQSDKEVELSNGGNNIVCNDMMLSYFLIPKKPTRRPDDGVWLSDDERHVDHRLTVTSLGMVCKVLENHSISNPVATEKLPEITVHRMPNRF